MLAHAQKVLTPPLLLFSLFFEAAALTSQARSQCWISRVAIHSSDQRHSEASDFRGLFGGEKKKKQKTTPQKNPPSLFNFPFRLARNELSAAAGCAARGRVEEDSGGTVC